MKKVSALVLTLIAALSNLTCLALNGDWRGELTLGPTKLPLVFHFSEDAEGGCLCTIDSPMQGAKGIPATVTFCTTDSIAIEIKAIGGSYSGKIINDKLDGYFSQMGHSFPLLLTPEKSIYERRPQTPKEPFPYTTTETTFTSADGTLLSATLTTPQQISETTPVVVLVTGSGPQNRDEELFDHRPFAVIADWLARNGIASLRYDDRGVGKSKGSFSTADIDDFKADAAAAVKSLRDMKRFGKIGVVGHSEGGTIAFMLAADGDADFAVSLAGAFAKGKDIILSQNIHTLDQLNISQKEKDDAISLISRVFDDIIDGKSYGDIKIDEYISSGNLDIPPMVLASLKQNIADSKGSHFQKLLSLDPSQWLGNIKIPVLALNGSLDSQVESSVNLGQLRKYLPAAEIKEYTGLNHMFQHANTGEITEYEQIEETISPEVLTDITDFIINN